MTTVSPLNSTPDSLHSSSLALCPVAVESNARLWLVQAAQAFHGRSTTLCMCATFTDADIGKTVENADGTPVGIVAAADRETVHVEPDPSTTDSIKATLGWELDHDDTVSLQLDDISTITDDVIRLEGERERHSSDETANGTDDSAVERDDSEQRDTDSTTGKAEKDREGTEGDSSDERHPGTEEAPPEGERTVTDERGRNEDR